MILTQCAACTAPLGLALGKKCGRCSTRYCGPRCQEQHWKEGGHDKLCKKIKKAGGAEQYYADEKHAEAVAVAAEACAADTKGQTCYICTEAVHWKTKEGLVRGCACRGTASFAHASCLAEQATILVAEAKETNLDYKVKDARWARWHTCGMCKQGYHGVVRCALGWACWKTYLGLPETHRLRSMAMNLLGNGLHYAKHYEDALSVREAELSTRRRLGHSEDTILAVQNNLASSYEILGHMDEALRMKLDVYSGLLNLHGKENEKTLIAANNYSSTLLGLQRFEAVKSLLRRTIPMTRRVLGESHESTLKLRWTYAEALYKDDDATLDDLREVVTTLEDTARSTHRVFGDSHPLTWGVEDELRQPRAALDARETPPSSASA